MLIDRGRGRKAGQRREIKFICYLLCTNLFTFINGLSLHTVKGVFAHSTDEETEAQINHGSCQSATEAEPCDFGIPTQCLLYPHSDGGAQVLGGCWGWG